MQTTIQHIAFACRDRLRSERFYTRHFGFRRVRVFNPDTPQEFVMLRLAATCIELFGAGAQGQGGEQVVGFKHLAFEVPDLDAAIARLKEDGIDVGPVYDCSAIAPGLRVCFFSDPDGNRVEIMQGWQDQF